MKNIIDDYVKWTRDLGKSPYMFPPNYIYHNKKWYSASPWNNSILVPNGINDIGSFNPISKKWKRNFYTFFFLSCIFVIQMYFVPNLLRVQPTKEFLQDSLIIMILSLRKAVD